MGLDMYLYKRVADGKGGEGDTVGYWRKFNALHGYIRDRYLPEDAESDNCVEMPLDVSALRCILVDLQTIADIFVKVGWLSNQYELIEKNAETVPLPQEDVSAIMEIMPPTMGFFFGTTDIDIWYALDVVTALKVFKEAYRDAQNGYEFYYYAWY